MDDGNREALRIDCGSSISSARLLRVLDELIDFCGKLQAIRMDNGPEMTSEKFASWGEQNGIELRHINPGKPNQNDCDEFFNKSVRQEVLDAWLLDSLAKAQQNLEGWRIEYNTVRSQESLGKKTPLAFLPRVVNDQISAFNLSTWRGSLRRDFTGRICKAVFREAGEYLRFPGDSTESSGYAAFIESKSLDELLAMKDLKGYLKQTANTAQVMNGLQYFLVFDEGDAVKGNFGKFWMAVHYCCSDVMMIFTTNNPMVTPASIRSRSDGIPFPTLTRE
jgi:hypothetical protein